MTITSTLCSTHDKIILLQIVLSVAYNSSKLKLTIEIFSIDSRSQLSYVRKQAMKQLNKSKLVDRPDQLLHWKLLKSTRGVRDKLAHLSDQL